MPQKIGVKEVWVDGDYKVEIYDGVLPEVLLLEQCSFPKVPGGSEVKVIDMRPKHTQSDIVWMGTREEFAFFASAMFEILKTYPVEKRP